ncbi:MAG: hypothetical protein WCZ08_04245, partial [Parcubacteria group bacterium]
TALVAVFKLFRTGLEGREWKKRTISLFQRPGPEGSPSSGPQNNPRKRIKDFIICHCEGVKRPWQSLADIRPFSLVAKKMGKKKPPHVLSAGQIS